MDPIIEFYLNLLGVFAAAGLVTWIMNILQKRKEEAADRQFKWTLKSRGLSETIIEPKGESSDSEIDKR